ncbi:MAG: class III signal peptide-containing protein [Candidatus Omnitrophica bacterium]|nr:class III signal peptide-containing protein [Candidatus Omnitrophota bacterium]
MKKRRLVTGYWSLVTTRGQSTLEYILVLAAIIAAIAIAAGTLIKPAVTKTMNDTKTVIEDATGKLKDGLSL